MDQGRGGRDGGGGGGGAGWVGGRPGMGVVGLRGPFEHPPSGARGSLKWIDQGFGRRLYMGGRGGDNAGYGKGWMDKGLGCERGGVRDGCGDAPGWALWACVGPLSILRAALGGCSKGPRR